MAEKVALVTGISGYLGGWIAKKLVEHGWQIRGTVRSLSDKEKTQHLEKLFPGIQLFEADLLKDGSFDAAVSGAHVVFHSASPFLSQVNDPQKDLVDPALNGTLNVLRSVEKADSVKRVVVTSSIAAVAKTGTPPEHVFTEVDWNDGSSVTFESYRYSKYIAEKSAYEFAQGKKFDLVSVCPSFILGPLLSARSDATSIKTVQSWLDGTKESGVGAATCFGAVDVRDVAEAHVRVAENPNAKGRYMVTSPTGVTHWELVNYLREGGYAAHKLPKAETVACTYRPLFSTAKVEKELGLQMSPLSKTLPDMAASMIEFGLVAKA